jgi:AAA family ATP:ADP antiporter
MADVHRGEAAGVLVMAAVMLLLLGAYYMLKTARDALILARGGAEAKSYAGAAEALILLVVVPVFSTLASRTNRIRLMRRVTLFFVASLVLFLTYGRTSPFVGIAYFIWIGVFSLVVITQYWGFAADLYTPSQGKRLFPIIGLGSSVGAWLGAIVAGRIVGAWGPFNLIAVGAGLLMAGMGLAVIVHRWEERHPDPARAQKCVEPVGDEGPFELIGSDRYLMLIAVYVVVFNLLDTSGDYIFSRLLVDQSIVHYGASAAAIGDRERFVGEMFGRFYSYANLAGLLLQAFLVSRVFKWVGVGRAVLVQPCVVLAGYALLLATPALSVVASFKVADKATDYSLGSTVRQTLWLPTSRAAKYKAKQAVDSLFVRLGDLVQAGIVYVGTLLSLGVGGFAIISVGLSTAWLLVSLRLGPAYDERAALVEESRTS